ncbi:MAG TPA: hypothetical protein VKV17_12615 [Bryobacteraceae bacterium]|nr:hypothetical protein [Bryobacteraceae bacterium]
MRGCAALLVLTAAATAHGYAQSRNASPLIRGVLVDREELPSGEFTVRAGDNQLFRYRFDSKTYVERNDRLVDVARLHPGDKVEVLSDEGPASAVRYARTIHVVLREPPPPRSRPQDPFLRHASLDPFQPLSTMTVAGVVASLGQDWLVLHTRHAGDQTILLRRDTRYLGDGERVEHSDLHPNMRVFIRAGRNLFNEVEAYQIIWGQILQPGQ